MINTLKLRFDPRAIVFVNHVGLLVFGIYLFNLQRSLLTIFLCAAWAVILNTVLNKILYNRNTPFNANISPVLTSLSFCILINSGYLSTYIFGISLCILSKFLLGTKDNHIFNPSLVGIIAIYTILPYGYYSVQSDQFLGSSFAIGQILFLGAIALTFANRLFMPIIYLCSLFSFAWLSSFFINFSWISIIGPEMSTPGLLYAFFMMTDPRTSPKTKKGQVLFSFFSALIVFYVNYLQIPFAIFISLFIMNFIYYFSKNMEVVVNHNPIWLDKYKTAA